MGEVVSIQEYLENKTSEVNQEELKQRILNLGYEVLLLTSEKNRLEKLLLQHSSKKT